MSLDVVSPTSSSVAPWVLLAIGAVGAFVLVLRAVRRGKRPPEA